MIEMVSRGTRRRVNAQGFHHYSYSRKRKKVNGLVGIGSKGTLTSRSIELPFGQPFVVELLAMGESRRVVMYVGCGGLSNKRMPASWSSTSSGAHSSNINARGRTPRGTRHYHNGSKRDKESSSTGRSARVVSLLRSSGSA